MITKCPDRLSGTGAAWFRKASSRVRAAPVTYSTMKKEERKQGSKEASKQASKQGRKEESKQASKQARKEGRKEARK